MVGRCGGYVAIVIVRIPNENGQSHKAHGTDLLNFQTNRVQRMGPL